MIGVSDFLQDCAGPVRDAFEATWDDVLNSTDRNYTHSPILSQGKRLRPRLVMWGALLATDGELDDASLSRALSVGVSIEMLHKASLIMDDIIDHDSMRYGSPSFHREFSVEEALTFPFLMIAESYRNLLQAVQGLKVRAELLDRFSSIISAMVRGGLIEIRGAGSGPSEEIAFLETAVLIRDSLMLGYLSAGGSPQGVESLSAIGREFGCLYQILNDAEPVLAPAAYALHKGEVDDDVLRVREGVLAVGHDVSGRQAAIEVLRQRVRASVGAIDFDIERLARILRPECVASFGLFFRALLEHFMNQLDVRLD